MKSFVRYDAKQNRFMWASEKKVYWPGTKIVKSGNNVFNWKRQPKEQYEVPGLRCVEHR